MTPNEAVLQFVEAINTQDLELLVELMTPDHRFIDSGGGETRGREAMAEAWSKYFDMVPDYSIAIDETFAQGGTVVTVGLASGAYSPGQDLRPENRWQIPAAWRAVVKGGRIAEWQVFADNEPMRKMMAEQGGE
jgi:ketosteroid isomerase-like protein